MKNLKYRENKLKKVHAKLTSLIDEKKRLFNNLNELQSEKNFRDFDEFSSLGKENLTQSFAGDHNMSNLHNLGLTINKYINLYEKIEVRLLEIGEQQIINEINNIEEGLWNE